MNIKFEKSIVYKMAMFKVVLKEKDGEILFKKGGRLVKVLNLFLPHGFPSIAADIKISFYSGNRNPGVDTPFYKILVRCPAYKTPKIRKVILEKAEEVNDSFKKSEEG